MGTLICIMPNGERLPIERWVYNNWAQGRLTDPMLLDILRRAIRIVER